MPGDSLPVGWGGADRTTPVRLPLTTIHRHALVTGTTGYGKSGLLLSVILGLLTTRTGTGCVVVDPKGETAEALRETFLPSLADRFADVAPGEVVTIAPFSAYGVPLNPCAPIQGLPTEVQAHHVGVLVAGLVDGVGPRMASLLGWILRAVIEARGSLLDVRRVVTEEGAGATLAPRVRDADVRDYLLRVLPTESRATKDALRARIEHLLLLPCLRAMLCAEGSISGRDAIEAPVALVDLSGSPLGMESTAQFVGGWVFTLLASAALTRPVTPTTHPVLLVVDEWHRVAVTAEGDLERLLSQVRHRKVGLWLANQTLGQVSGLSASLLQSLLTNISIQALFRPRPEDLRDLDDLLPVTGRKVDPDAPDRLLTRDEERRRYKAMLSRLPPREALLVDRIGGSAQVVTTLGLPFAEAARRARMLPDHMRDAWRRGRFGVPMETLLAQARPGRAATPTPAPATRPRVQVVRAPGTAEPIPEPVVVEPAVALPVPEPAAAGRRPRAPRERLRLVLPS